MSLSESISGFLTRSDEYEDTTIYQIASSVSHLRKIEIPIYFFYVQLYFLRSILVFTPRDLWFSGYFLDAYP